MRNKRFKFALAATIACIVLLIGATLAYFTDRAKVSASGTAGTVEIQVDDSKFTLINPDGNINNFNPGDGRLIDAKITNLGNKSVDVRRTFQITMTPATGIPEFTKLPDDASVPMGWAVYAASDCVKNATTGNYVVNNNAVPIVPVDATVDDATGAVTVQYLAPTDAVLNGKVGAPNAETEDEATSNVLDNNEYVLAMIPGSDNSYQGATITLDLLVEAKQHRNTANVQWDTLQTVSATITGISDAVPAKGEDYLGNEIVTP